METGQTTGEYTLLRGQIATQIGEQVSQQPNILTTVIADNDGIHRGYF